MSHNEQSNSSLPEGAPSYWGILPARVRYARIPSSAKLLFVEISALQNVHGYCGAGNSYFAELYGISERSLERWLKHLKNAGFIALEFTRFRDEQGRIKTARRIWTLVDQYGNHRFQPPDKNVDHPFSPPDISVIDHPTEMSFDKNVTDPPTFLSPPPDKNVGYNSTVLNNITNSTNGAPAAHVEGVGENERLFSEDKENENRSEGLSKSDPAPLPLNEPFASTLSPEDCAEGHSSEHSQPENSRNPQLFAAPSGDTPPLRRSDYLEIINHGLEVNRRTSGQSIDPRTINWPHEIKQIKNLVRRGYAKAEIISLLDLLGDARSKGEYYAKELPVLPSRLSLRVIQNLAQFQNRHRSPYSSDTSDRAEFDNELAEKARKREAMMDDPLVLELEDAQ